MSNGPDGGLIAQARQQTPKHDLKMTAFFRRGSVCCLVQHPAHVFVALGGATAVILLCAFSLAGTGSHPRGQLRCRCERTGLCPYFGDGYAICFPIYSTFQGPGLFLADVYVRPQFRDKGIGKAMIGEVAAMALREGCGALRWEVLAWNQPAIDFYKKLGAVFLDDWKAVRIEGEALRRLAEQSNA